MRKIGAALMLVASAGVSAQILPAPPGDPKVVALRAIREAEHPCPKLTQARRVMDDSIVASCSNKESYRVFAIRTKDGKVTNIAMKCSAARALGIEGAC